MYIGCHIRFMMQLSNDIVLRPRFKFNVNQSSESLLTLFENEGKNQTNFIVTRIDDHVFIKFPKTEQHFWSPQLHLEINEDYDDKQLSTVYGLFGPNPTVWTMFMFFHFVVACFFIGFGIWAYTNMTLGMSYAVQLFLTILMVVVWFVLYVVGRMGKSKGRPEMKQLHLFMRQVLKKQ